MHNIESARVEHRQILLLMGQLGGFLERDAPPDPLSLLHLRRELGRLVLTHVKREDWAVYPRLISHGEPALAAAARRLADEAGGLIDRFLAYAREWTSPRIAQDWAGYRAATRAIFAELRERIEREERELFPLALGPIRDAA